MNSKANPTGRRQPLPSCFACGEPIPPGLAAVVRTPERSPLVCMGCHARAQQSAAFRADVERAVATGVPLPDIQRAFASIGVFEMPKTFAECAEAIGVPEEMLAEMLADFRRA